MRLFGRVKLGVIEVKVYGNWITLSDMLGNGK